MYINVHCALDLDLLCCTNFGAGVSLLFVVVIECLCSTLQHELVLFLSGIPAHNTFHFHIITYKSKCAFLNG